MASTEMVYFSVAAYDSIAEEYVYQREMCALPATGGFCLDVEDVN